MSFWIVLEFNEIGHGCELFYQLRLDCKIILMKTNYIKLVSCEIMVINRGARNILREN